MTPPASRKFALVVVVLVALGGIYWWFARPADAPPSTLETPQPIAQAPRPAPIATPAVSAPPPAVAPTPLPVPVDAPTPPSASGMTREQARALLAKRVSDLTAQAMALPVQVEFDFEMPDTPNGKAAYAQIFPGLPTAEMVGLIARDRERKTMAVQRVPVPPVENALAAHLTDEDLNEYRWAYAVAAFRLRADRQASAAWEKKKAVEAAAKAKAVP